MLPFTLLLCLLPSIVLAYRHNEPQLPLQLDEHVNRFNKSYFDESIVSFMKAREIPGLSVALTYDDRLIYASAFGYADQENDLLVTTADRFRLASVSKSITAIAIMHLAELGALNLTSRVFGKGNVLGSSYSGKTYNEWEKQITIQHLLEHTSGFVNDDICGKGCDPTYLPETMGLDQWELVRTILDKNTPSHAPGTFASYSNFAYFILGRVVEAVASTRDYSTYVLDEILKPLNISSIQIASDNKAEDDITYYDFEDANAPYSFHVSRRDSVGAWTASPVDLVKILTSIDGLSGRQDILTPRSTKAMFSKSTVTNSSFAKGWTVKFDSSSTSSSDLGLIEASKDGGYPGTNAFWNINFLNKTSYAIVINREIERAPEKGFNGGFDMKILMDNLTFPILEWPGWDLFDS
jgi:CubicO group peptidase (beta-lactamase class C family)